MQSGCGRTGCWETVVGLTALLHKATDSDDPVRDPSLDVEQRLAGITRRAEAGDARTLSALKDVGTWHVAVVGSASTAPPPPPPTYTYSSGY